MQSRYYDPETGRFIGYNAFAYCENDPVGREDRSGKLSSLEVDVVAMVLVLQASLLIESFLNYLFPKQKHYFSTKLKVDKNGLFSIKAKYYKSKLNRNELKITFGDYSSWKNSMSAYNANSKIYYDYYSDCVMSEANNPQYNFWYLLFMTDVVLLGTIAHFSIKGSTAKKVYNKIWGSNGIDKNNKNNLFAFYVTQEKSYNGVYYYSPKKDSFGKVK